MEAKRRSGRTTAKIFQYIHQALAENLTYGSNPPWILVNDHFESKEADRLLLTQIEGIVKLCELEGFEFSRMKIALRCTYKPPRICRCGLEIKE